MLEVKNLHATIAGKEILKGINLTIGVGEIHSIMGPNGSGRDTKCQIKKDTKGRLPKQEVFNNAWSL